VVLAERRYSLAELSRNATAVALVLAPVAMVAMVVVYGVAAPTIFRDLSFGNYLIAVAAVPFTLHALWLGNFFLLAKQLARSQLARVAGGVAQFAGAVILYALGVLGVTEVLLLYTMTAAVIWLFLMRWSRRVAPVRPALDPALVRDVAGLGVRIHAANLVFFLLLRGDTFLVSGFLGTADVGIYSLAVLFGELALLVTTPLTEAALPFQVEVSTPDSADLAFKAARFNFALAVLIAAAFSASLWLLIPTLYGEQFAPAYPALVALLPGVILMAASRPLALLLLRQRQPLVYGGLGLAALALNVALNVVLLPSIGIIGASVASSLAYAVLGLGFIVWGLRIAPDRAARLLLPQRGDLDTLRRIWERFSTGMLRPRARG
jgi:O-antigen/teichoic acid export membrane protein